MIKIYCDTADIKTIKKCINSYKVDGVTTNPSIMRANGVRNYKEQCLKILKITKTTLIDKINVSVAINSDLSIFDFDEILKQILFHLQQNL